MKLTKEESQIFRWYVIVRRHTLLFILLPFIAAAVGFVQASRKPMTFQAKATLYVTGSLGSLPNMQMNDMPFMGQAFNRGGSSVEYVKTLLESEKVALRVVKELHLDKDKRITGQIELEEGEKLNPAKIAAVMAKNIKVIPFGGLVVVYIDASTETLARKITNEYLNVLGEILMSDKERRFLAIEKQMSVAKESLSGTESRLAEYQRSAETGATDMDAQTVSLYTSLIRDRMSAELELEQSLRMLNDNENLLKEPELRLTIASLKTRIKGLNEQVGRLQAKLDRIPGKTLENTRLLREMKNQEAFFTGLLQQYEMQRMTIADESELFQVIDRPNVIKYIPRGRIKAGIVGACAGLILAVIIAFLLEQIRTGGEDLLRGDGPAARA